MLGALLFPASRYKNWIFIGVLLLISFSYQYYEILDLEPQAMHSWRQADCASLAYGFIEESNPFDPQMHNQLGDDFTSGRSAGEFTGLYYVVGKLWAMFGHHNWIFRLVVLLIFFASIFRMFKALCRHVDQFWAYIGALLLFTSPLIVFYANNFLSNVPSLAFAILGWAVYLDFRVDRKTRQWLILTLFFVLAGLLKVTGLVSFIAICGTEVLLRILTSERRFGWKEIALTIMGLGMVYGWYKYASIFNKAHGGKYTFNDLWPIWEMSAEQIDRAIGFFQDITFYQLLSIPGYALLLGTLVFLILRFRRFPIDLKLATIFSLVGFSIYLMLWFNAVEHHDYYFINVLILPLILCVGLAFTLKASGSVFNKKWIRITVLLLTLMAIVYTGNNIRMRYYDHLDVNESLALKITTPLERGYWQWMANDDYLDVFFEMDSVLLSHGVSREDRVVSVPDPSFNISLYNMNRKGWTSYGYNMEKPDVLREKISKGAKYLIYAQGKGADLTPIQEFLTDTVTTYKNAVVFRLPPPEMPGNE